MAKISPPKLGAASLHPKNWGAWILIGFMFSISLLPFRIQHYLGLGIGRLAKKLLKSRVHITRRNLEICFPDKSAEQREQLVEGCFKHLGHSVVDTANAWFWPQWRFAKHFKVEGAEHLNKAREKDGGILLISAHFWTLESHARAYGTLDPGVGIYRPNKNAVYEYFQYHGRTKSNKYLVDRTDVRGMIKALRTNNAVWYAPDHDYGTHAAVFVPFFAQDKAATITGTATLAKVKNVQILPTYALRNNDGSGFTLVIEPAVENYPSGNDEQDAHTVNQIVEKAILRAPEQYMWIHRRFKSRPPGESGVY
ncbi:LpxL/LpxP family Kdo(2)-lipid IV(A) lauroyl/palmitoleoyl acyltransferase [Agarivorans sp. 1_MG-2023]|uniref:LpxL/LpxP family Kdo(2)-lipid IV(A) lauroyl/palmitoleoyl acyltransferase n=1 Tax=Agarivorans sp. 1_MG-2023 TaxID=3062634 RepID=UPI0026E1ED2B|nr:LpxL/LpxP family Kdo(2)-lipid IV(A) lauroyl/palmitoleoyl acyltransferase [Agarivorans sp. 1_MG-2023]MDO6763733.1 LpxL/LpxP family Kdo(2)-lipid IV(A) lauroyl/palmitoleoyl acyltransferase [Agarivorans sp. 1_MG-2023]